MYEVGGAVVQRIGHIPSKDTMLVRFQPALPEYWIFLKEKSGKRI